MSSSPRAWSNEAFVARTLRRRGLRRLGRLRRRPRNSPEALQIDHAAFRLPIRPRRRAAVRHRRQRRDLLRARRHRTQPGQHRGDGDRQPGDGDRQYRPPRRRGEPAARPEQRAGQLRHGQLPARTARLPPCQPMPAVRAIYEAEWGVHARPRTGPAHPQHAGRRGRRQLSAASTSRARTSCSPIPTRSMSPPAWPAMECVVVQDLFLNETANYAHVFLPGATFLEKDGTFINAERRINRVRKVMAAARGTGRLGSDPGDRQRHGLRHALHASVARSWPRSPAPRRPSPVSPTKSWSRARCSGPCNDAAPDGTPIMHIDGFVRGKGNFVITEYVPTDEKVGPRFPLLLTTGRILSQYNVGAQTRRTANVVWHAGGPAGDPSARRRGTRREATATGCGCAAAPGETTLRATVTERVAPGVVYTTFHHPLTQANVVTTDYSDWATNCPEYKVTAVQVSPSNGPSRLADRIPRADGGAPPHRGGRRPVSKTRRASCVTADPCPGPCRPWPCRPGHTQAASHA